MPIPQEFDFGTANGLLTESKQKFLKIKPRTLGQAKRIPGVTPADVQILWITLEKNRRQKKTEMVLN
ncbi:MAG: hypothetical protein HY547_02960 [Elusimicrobia bacterium]|nr:hypothetical protein [Elusimicrobiota bacterium]